MNFFSDNLSHLRPKLPLLKGIQFHSSSYTFPPSRKSLLHTESLVKTEHKTGKVVHGTIITYIGFESYTRQVEQTNCLGILLCISPRIVDILSLTDKSTITRAHCYVCSEEKDGRQVG